MKILTFASMPDDSTFFSPNDDRPLSAAQNTTGPREPKLVHRSENGWTEIYLVDKDGRFRALKALRPEFRGQTRYESLLRKEYEIGYSLSNTAIREIYDFRDIPGLGNCIEMEWVDGITLSEFLTAGNTDERTARKIAIQLCDALSYIHSKQIVHRDIKPSNILITHNGNYVKLIDFGLSDADVYSVLKGPAGTASFAAPELLSGKQVDNRADIWSLGKVISLLLPKERRIVSRCLQENPESRFKTVDEIKMALGRRRGLKPALYIPAIIIAIAAIIFISRSFRTVDADTPAPAEEVTDTLDAGAIDELFRQATEMIDDAASQ